MASNLILFEITLKSSSLGKEEGSQNYSKSSPKEDLQFEPMIGHMKQEGKLGFCRLKGIVGNQLNALLTGVGHQSPTDSEPHQKTTKAWKAKEFFDPNFIPFAGVFFTKNLSS